ncbi:response regulator [Sphingomonas sp.]|uniref:response regulator transcription factor n=1 Tax=Sphingomonas sp. TaxID=28214 RepID=UPI001B1BE140|nr:response regulator [Sphingomonas sp.]MBO9714228.1 response regulator [Sphingomonas sp.]
MTAETLISIVDDDTSLLNALVRLVRSLGYKAQGFPSAEDFIASDIAQDCSCVITDIQMGGMSGIELAGVLSGQKPRVPVIVITARPDEGLEEAAMAQGATCFLRKPVETNRLAQCLEHAIAA